MKLFDHIQTKHPEKIQDSLGTSRVCEWQALARVAEQIGAGSYCSIGHDDGLDFLSLAANYRGIPSISFDEQAPSVANIHYDGVEWYRVAAKPDLGDTKKMHQILDGFIKQNGQLGPMLFYVNCRYKLDMMRELVRHVRPGDVIGTHDWGTDKMTVVGTFTEVPEKRCGFLYEQGLKVYQPIENWLTKHKSVQKFWIR